MPEIHGLPKCVRYRIEDEIFKTKLDKETDFAKVRFYKRDLQSLLPPHLFIDILEHAKNAAEFYSRDQIAGHKRKLSYLCSNSWWDKMSNKGSVKNISSYSLSTDEHTSLGIGM